MIHTGRHKQVCNSHTDAEKETTKINMHTHLCTSINMRMLCSLIAFILNMLMVLQVVAHLLQMYCKPGCDRFSLSHGQPLVSVHFRAAWKSICKDLNHAWEYFKQHELICRPKVFQNSFSWYLYVFVRVYMIYDFRAFKQPFKMPNKTDPHCICVQHTVTM